jgi:hypothetical protein
MAERCPVCRGYGHSPGKPQVRILGMNIRKSEVKP